MQEAYAYVDPGSGFVFLQNTSIWWGWLLGIFMLLLVPFKLFLKPLKKFFWVFIALVIILIIVGVIMNNSAFKTKKKMIVLGIDAMDFRITQELLAQGRLPNFSYLKDHGSFRALDTTNPSESAVAWSSFATGLNPAGHGIFDFIMRNPDTYSPYLTLNEILSSGGRVNVNQRRKGEAFWDVLAKKRIPSFIYFLPNTFPAEKINGEMVSGMGVPDILGVMGRFSFYTTKELVQDDKDSRGRIIRVKLAGGSIQTELYGPKVNIKGNLSESKIPLKIETKDNGAFIEVQGNKFFLEKGAWSGWKRVYFKIGFLKKARGIARFYLKNTSGPDLELYVSPINFDPTSPLFAISYPEDLSGKLAKRVGLFYTQGMPHDTWALSENRIDEAVFLEHVDIILNERTKILQDRLSRFKGGLFFFYFDTLDMVQHMFWRYIDAKSPLFEANSAYSGTIYRYYEKIDAILGDILKKIDKDTTLVVLSDHGFGPFRRSVHLNRWLLENGYLTLNENKNQGGEFFDDIDWHKTKAYALGFGGIYINREGREKYGVVEKSEVEGLKKEIQQKLKLWIDPATGEPVAKEVYDAEKVFQGPYMNEAPDLFVGFNSGYRASWQTALGAVPNVLIEDNKKKWSGDHLVDPSLVPGILFSNKKQQFKAGSISDVIKDILTCFE